MPLRVLFLAKRFPQQRDLIERPYGRFYHLPVALAALGHDVRVQLCSHRRADSVETQRAGVHWSSHDVVTPRTRRIWTSIVAEASSFRPDWIIGCSDTWLGWLAYRLADRIGSRLAVDAYDNYESYMPWNVPLHRAWRRAVHAADLVTAAGPQLAARLQLERPGRSVEVLPMAADPEFKVMDRGECRQLLGLPDAAPLVGYSGSWARKRGTAVLLQSFERILAVRPEARLVLSGSPSARTRAAPGVIALGHLEDARLPALLNALDVACVVTADNSFGRYSYPAKLCEAMACGIAVVATASGPVRWMLRDDSRFLAPLGDADAIAARVLSNLSADRVEYGELPSWHQCGQRLADLLTSHI